MGSCISGGGLSSYTTFGTWGRGDEGNKKYIYIFLLLIYAQYQDSLNNTVIPYVFLPFLAENYESYLIYVK